jgi:twitching motility protein PilT
MNWEFTPNYKWAFVQDDLVKFIQDILKTRDITYADFQKMKDIDISYETSIDWVPHYFRVNLFFSSGRPGAVLRYIKNDIPSLEKLNFPVKYIQKFLTAKDWLYLVAWSTGSGKSTTVAAIIDYYNKNRNSHIVTLEDPIEYKFKPIKCWFNQREIWTDCLSYANWLMSALREAPDIIFLWELREFETIDLALKLAESWHIVISTIHTKDASSVISRILNTVPDGRIEEVRTVLANAFKWVIYQELIPTKDGWRILAVETMYEHHTVWATIQQWNTWKLRSLIETNRDAGMITKSRYIEEEIIPKGVVDAMTLKKYLAE